MQLRYRALITIVLCMLFGLVYMGIMGAFQTLEKMQSSTVGDLQRSQYSALRDHVRPSPEALETDVNPAYAQFVLERPGLYVFALLAVPLVVLLFAFLQFERWYVRMWNRACIQELYLDPLTDAWNRRAGERDLSYRFHEWKVAQANSAIFFLDIDDFKAINDLWGHDVGDLVLQRVVAQVETVLGDAGKIYRWGGEEFLVICPMENFVPVDELGRLIVQAVAATPQQSASPLAVTASVGMTVFQASDEHYSQAVRRADRAMYYSKCSGKNRVTDCQELARHDLR